MKRNLLLLVALTLLSVIGLQAQTSLQGTVTDKTTGEPIILAYVVLLKNGVQITGTDTDFEGRYAISNIDPGTYDVEVSIISHRPALIQDVVIKAGQTNFLDVELSKGIDLQKVVITEYTAPLIEQDENTQGKTLTSKDIQHLPVKSVTALAATTAGVTKSASGVINIRGARANATTYIVDGIRVTGVLPQASQIEQMQVITGGISALYGDVTGGVIKVITKGPSSKFSGSVEGETSEFLDPYGYNLARFSLSGPIWKKDDRSILGFRIGAQYTYRQDDNPVAFGEYYSSQEAINYLHEHPLQFIKGLQFATGEALRDVGTNNTLFSAIDLYETHKNEAQRDVNIFGKFDIRLSDAVDIQLTGSYYDIKDRFTPGGWTLVNYGRNPYTLSNGYRLNGRLRYRIGKNYSSTEGSDSKPGFIRNTSITLHAGYEKNFSSNEDLIHGDHFGRYGYVGKFNTKFDPFIQLVPNITTDTANVKGGTFFPNPLLPGTGYWVKQIGVTELDKDDYYIPDTTFKYNPILVNYNNSVKNESSDNMIAYNGRILSFGTSLWSIYSNVGAVYNNYTKSENELYTGKFSVSFDLFPGGSDKGRHNIQFGALYEQRVYRGYGVAPIQLWVRAGQLANAGIIGVDYSAAPIDSQLTASQFPFQDSLYVKIYPNLLDTSLGTFFVNARKRLFDNKQLNDYINIQSIDPDDLTLDLFGARELTDRGDVSYYGYNYLGRKVEGVSFKDFFADSNNDGKQDFVVAPFRPTYVAGYIQDKFSFKDLIFRVGVRVDVYDANTKVLRYPNSLYRLMTAKDFYAQNPEITRPGNVEDDYRVYLQNPQDNRPYGFRKGNNWYDANGTQLNGGAQLWGGAPVFGKRYNDIDITDYDFVSKEFENTFKDYETQVNVMPRLAFSFPISDVANFYAHYDILTQRPSFGTSYVSPLSYFYMDQAGRVPLNNPALNPVKTIDYEVGFQQKLSNSSAVKIGAYYKEMRDLIQRRKVLYVPGVNRYDTYGNIDFGTVYGFTVSYDLRRTGNFRANINYTLQFANGTGSNANSQAGLLVRGNIRTLFPLNFDERHRIVLNGDYRYSSGKEYSGPRIAGVDILANTGLNVQFIASSGRPYSAAKGPAQFGSIGIAGSINGARLPWNYTVDLRLDKTIRLTPADAQRPLYLNVYFRVRNLFDTRNIVGVYRFTGSPSDDGFLSSSTGQQTLESTIATRQYLDANIDAYLEFYNWAMLNQGFYSAPRRMYIGAIFQF